MATVKQTNDTTWRVELTASEASALLVAETQGWQTFPNAINGWFKSLLAKIYESDAVYIQAKLKEAGPSQRDRIKAILSETKPS